MRRLVTGAVALALAAASVSFLGAPAASASTGPDLRIPAFWSFEIPAPEMNACQQANMARELAKLAGVELSPEVAFALISLDCNG